MRLLRSARLGLAAAVVLLGVAAVVAGCGGHPAAQTTKTATQRFTAILGHAPSGLAATVAARGTLIVGEDPQFAPQSSVDSTDAWSGFDVDVARAIATALGLKVEFRQFDWARMPSALAAGRYDVAISSIAADPRPSDRLALSAPYAYSTAQIVVRGGATPLTTLPELQGKTIGVTASTSFQQFLEAATAWASRSTRPTPTRCPTWATARWPEP